MFYYCFVACICLYRLGQRCAEHAGKYNVSTLVFSLHLFLSLSLSNIYIYIGRRNSIAAEQKGLVNDPPDRQVGACVPRPLRLGRLGRADRGLMAL